MTNSVSLQTRLVKTSLISSIVAGSVALLLFLLVSAYQTMQIQDEIMDEISDMLLITDLTNNTGQQVDEFSEEFDIQYQLRQGQQVLTQSEDFKFNAKPQTVLSGLDDHYGLVWHDKHLWRSYTAQDENTNMRVFVLQPFIDRFKELFHSLLAYGLILLTLWLLQWLMLHVLIKRQFRVIDQLSTQIAQKHADDLAPIHSKASELKELQPIILQLNQLLKRLDLSLTAEQRFTSDASHELRSPLSAIQMRLQLLQRKHPEMTTEFTDMQADVKRGTQVLENLLLLARLDPEHADHLPKIRFKLDDLVHELVQVLKPLAHEKNIEFTPKIPLEHIDFQIYANRDLVFICLRNLMDNAIRYSPLSAKIILQFSANRNQLFFSIENPGQILDTDTMARLGERFYRILGTQTQGSGLGLSICKKIMDLHHGDIQFYALQQGGLRVTCIFPIA